MRKSLRQPDCPCERPSCKDLILCGLKGLLIVIVFGFAFYRSLWGCIALIPLGVGYYLLERKRVQRDNQDKFMHQFKECILSVATLLRAGYAAENAFLECNQDMRSLYGEKSLIYKELEYIRRGLVINISLEELLYRLAKRSKAEEIYQFSRVFSIAKKSGGNLPDIIGTTANLISQKIEAKQEIATLLSGKQMEQKIMGIMPFGILLYIGWSYPGYFDSLYHNLRGVVIMSVCILIYLTAFLLGQKILRGIDDELSGKIKKVAFVMDKNKPPRKLCLLLDKIFCRKPSVTVARDLKGLYPQEKKEVLVNHYYWYKIRKCGTILIAGEILSLLLYLKNTSLYVGAFVLLLTIVLFFLMDRDLHQEMEKQKKAWQFIYPDIVHKLVLYLGAGLSIRGCFEKLSKEYPIALYTSREIAMGVSEPRAYENFGKRTGILEYIRLGTLLSQNLKRGNTTLLIRLEEEAYKASKDRVQKAKKLGEEAGTKLLFPMALYLLVVMLMIMVPAFQGLEL